MSVSVALASAGCTSTPSANTLDASADATTLEDGSTSDARPGDDAAHDDAALDDAALDDAALDDAALDDASLDDAAVGTLCGTDWVDVAVDVHHCGTCDRDCTLLPGVDASLVACASGMCVLACDTHRADCDGDPDSGCEATLDTPARCGACDVSCAGATPICDTTTVPAACVSGCALAQVRCGDACVDLDSSVGDCGVCGNACPSAAHASAVCDDGDCALACDVGYHDCGGACVDDTDLATCGAACAPCAADPHGTAVCEPGGCTLACAPGYALAAGQCVNVDECAATPTLCGAGAIACDDLDGSYACTCGSGFVAPAMGGACDDVDECAATPGICGTHGTGGTNARGCTNVDGTYACSCRPGAFAPPTGGVCATSCGDGIQGPDEMCDDGAQLSNDGCSSTCRLELFAGWNCTGSAPTRCTINWTFDSSSEAFSATVSGFGIFAWSGAAHAWHANASPEVSDFTLASPTRVAPPGTIRAVVVLTHTLNFQNGRDGAIVEFSIDGGAFTALDPVSGEGYSRWLGTFDNPLGARFGFSGQVASTTSTFHVPVTAGHEFRIRFRVGTDSNAINQPPNPAWSIENVSVTFAR